jgi:hypothetical protein
MSPTTKSDIIRRLIVQRDQPDSPEAASEYTHRLTAQTVDYSASRLPQPIPFAVTAAVSAELARTLPDFELGDTHLDCRLDTREDSPLYCELQLAALVRHHLGWSPLASEVMYRRSARLPSLLLGLYRTADPAVRRLMPVVIFPSYEKYLPWQLPALVTPKLEYAMRYTGADAVRGVTDGYHVTTWDPAAWDDPDFEAGVLFFMLRHLKWAADDFTIVYDGPATETVHSAT